MSTEALEEQGGAETGAADAETETARDWEAEARSMGWTAKDEFRGDEKRWVDAETFVRRGEEMMPIIKAQNKALKNEIADLKKQVARASDFFSKAEQRAYNQAIEDLKRQQREAVETGDVAAFEKIDQKMEDLRRDVSAQVAPGGGTEDDRVESFIAWREANPWYQSDDLKTMFADKVAGEIMRSEGLDPSKGQFLTRKHLDQVAARVAERFPTEEAPKPKARSAVEAPTGGRRSPGGKTFSDLPVEAQRMADKWVKSGLIKSRDDYVKSYQW